MLTGGTLSGAVCEYKIKLPVVQRLSGKILSAIEHLHLYKIVHRDIKGMNIVLDDSNLEICEPKLTDFGLAKNLKGEVTILGEISFGKGTPNFQSHETENGSFNVGRKCDIWSFACVVIEMLTGTSPQRKLIENRDKGDTQLPDAVLVPVIPVGIPPVLHSMLESCLILSPSLRPSANELLEGPFFGQSFENITYPDKRKERPC